MPSARKDVNAALARKMILANMQQRKIVNPYVTAEDWRKIMEAPKMKWKLLDGKISIYRVCDVIRCDIKRDETIRKVVKR